MAMTEQAAKKARLDISQTGHLLFKSPCPSAAAKPSSPVCHSNIVALEVCALSRPCFLRGNSGLLHSQLACMLQQANCPVSHCRRAHTLCNALTKACGDFGLCCRSWTEAVSLHGWQLAVLCTRSHALRQLMRQQRLARKAACYPPSEMCEHATFMGLNLLPARLLHLQMSILLVFELAPCGAYVSAQDDLQKCTR